MTNQPDLNQPVEVSVIIATRNRARLLGETLGHLGGQMRSDIRAEMVVVDNGSTDDTPAVLARAREELPLVALSEPRQGKARALNAALGVARGELLVFTDDDVVPAAGWLANICSASRRWPEYNIFCGPIVPLLPAAAPRWLRNHVFAAPAFGRFLSTQTEGPLLNGEMPYGANYAVRARAMAELRYSLKLGPQGAHSTLGEETEMLQRLCRRGEGIIYVPPAAVEHLVQERQLEYSWLMERAFQHGRGLARRTAAFDSRPVFGVPWRLWYRVAFDWAKYTLKKYQPPRRRFDRGLSMYSHWGQVYEYRRMVRERKKGRGAHEGGAAVDRRDDAAGLSPDLGTDA